MRTVEVSTLLLLIVFGFRASADKVEFSGGQPVIGSPATSAHATYYAPTFTYSADGASAYIYVQGQDNTDDSWCSVDEIYMYQAPNTWAGLTSPYERKRTILPDTSGDNPGYEGTPCIPGNPSYGGPAVFRSGNAFYMTVSRSTDADQDFSEIHWGVSTATTRNGVPYAAGYYWKWNRLLKWATGTTTNKITAVAVTETTINSQKYYFGTIELWTSNQIGLGAIRIHAAANARGYDTVEIMNSSNVWQAVNADGTFTFMPKVVWNAAIESQIVVENGSLYIWASDIGAVPTNVCTECAGSGQQRTGFADRFAYRTVVPSTLALGTKQNVTSQIRCMPGPYDNSRIFPAYVAAGSLLYSSTDSNCSINHYGQYIVVTGLQ
jgi:hypothetical protein